MNLLLNKTVPALTGSRWRGNLAASGVSGDEAYWWVPIPSDFESLDSAFINLSRSSGDTGTLSLDLHSCRCIDGELESATTEDDTSFTIDVTSTEPIFVDISSVLQTLDSDDAGGHMAVAIVNQAATYFFPFVGQFNYTNNEGVKKTCTLITTYFDTEVGAQTARRPGKLVLSTASLNFNFNIPPKIAQITRASIFFRKGSSGSGDKNFTFELNTAGNGEAHATNTDTDTIVKNIATGIRIIEVDIMTILKDVIPNSTYSGGVITLDDPDSFEGLHGGGLFTNNAGISAYLVGGIIEMDFSS